MQVCGRSAVVLLAASTSARLPAAPALSTALNTLCRRLRAQACTQVSLFPAENGVLGSISPFRQDLLALLKGLHPK